MEPVVYDETPLADYLRGEPAVRRPRHRRSLTLLTEGGDECEADWAAAAETAPSHSSSPPSPTSSSSSPPCSPSPFAPTGRPLVKARFRTAVPAYPRPSASALQAIWQSCSAVLVASIDGSDNCKFLEQFRYTIVASQLLNGHSVLSHRPATTGTDPSTVDPRDQLFASGLIAPILGALAIVLFLSWVRGNSVLPHYSRKRFVFVLAIFAGVAFVGRVYLKRQWLRYQKDQCLYEIKTFVSKSHDFDSAIEATMSIVQEVELVARGYRIRTPLPPISRLEDRSQSRKCVRLRKTLKDSFSHILTAYGQASNAIKAFSEQSELEKYYDMYDISDFDVADALQGYSNTEFDDLESLRTLKILAARFHTTRKMLLCGLLALDASGDVAELPRWSAALEALHGLNASTWAFYRKIRTVLGQEESFPMPPSPKGPLTPGRERWRCQLRKLNPLSTGIRGLQAKLHLLREESDQVLNHSDISELGLNLMLQYESIGVDLKELMAAWEDGKAALALDIDRNEKRLSSMSLMPSSASSLSGLTTVEEGDATVALKLLTGDASPPTEPVEPDMSEVFEAVAQPRSRSLLTREERLARMREEREQKAQARQQIDATRGMLRELESVISLRPRVRASPATSGGRIVSV